MENTQQNKSINKGRPIYFSYARNSIRQAGWEHISDCVTKILEIFGDQNIEYRVDVRDIGSGDKISDFEREIGWNSEVVILVISDKYFRSLHCMYEFVQIKQALKKHPEKRLICIRSGNVDISDQKYIMEVEHYWGDQRQQYETIEFHHLRSHSATEQAAHKNGFYLNDIRNLESFFSKYTWYDADTDDWSPMLSEITNYYTTTKKSFLLRMHERKAKLSKLKWFAIGYVILLIIGFAIFGYYSYCINHTVNSTDYPEYEENCYVHDNDAYTIVTKYTFDTTYTTLYFHSVNLTDDTLRRVEYDTAGALINRNGESGKHKLLKICGLNNTNLPEYYPGGKGTSVDYYMKFKSLGASDIDFITNNPQHCIYGISFRNSNMQNKKLFGNWKQAKSNCLTIEHPEYSQGIKNLFVNKIEIYDWTPTVLLFHMINPTDKDSTLFCPNDCYIVANGDTVKCLSANGIKTYPYRSIAYKKTAIDFALFFSFVDYETTDSIDFIINDTTKICGLKLRKNNYISVQNPVVTGYNFGGANITKVEVDSNATVVHFRYNNSFKKKEIYTWASQKSYIQADGKKYPITNASGIAFKSGKTMIPPHSSLDYALIFPPIPPDTETMNYVNTEFTLEKLGQKGFLALTALLGNECANETGDTISTGTFGIRLK